eukprot:gi/632956220/ref/XP_007893851.1/ PREDICTED: kinetochore protein Nuf2 [Callorhinchus milii]
MEMENRLTFPNYKVDSIVEFFRSSVLTGSEVNSLTKNDLVPIAKAEVVQRLYLRSLQAVFDARVESFYMLPGDENMPYLQLSEGFAPIMNLYVSMQRFMPMCQLPNFEMSDLMNPKTKRTIHILSGIMNFLKFRKRVLENYLEQQNGFKVNAEMMQHMLSTNEDMKRKIEKLTTIPDDQRAEIQELSACITELHQTLNHDYCNEQNSVQEATAQLKAEIAESNKKLSQLKVDLTSAKGSKAKLKMQIVECPEQLKKEMEKMRELAQKKKETIREKNERIIDLQDKSANFTNFQKKELETYCNILQEAQAGSDKINSMNTEIWKADNERESKNMELTNMQTEQVQLKRILASKIEKRDKYQMQRQKKQEAQDYHLEIRATDCDQLKIRRLEVIEQIAQIHKECQQIEAQSQELEKRCEKDVFELQNLCSNLLILMENYHEGLANVTHKALQGRREKMVKLERAMNERT